MPNIVAILAPTSLSKKLIVSFSLMEERRKERWEKMVFSPSIDVGPQGGAGADIEEDDGGAGKIS